MAVADAGRVALPFVLRARSHSEFRARFPIPVEPPRALADAEAVLHATRAEIRRLSVAQEQLLALLTAESGDPLVSGPASAVAVRGERYDRQDPTLEFRLFRFFEVRRGQQTADRWTSRKARLLLAYLVMKGEAPATRESLIDTFWPDSSPERGANNLSIAIHQIRTRLGGLVPEDERGIHVEQGTYRLSTDVGMSVDVVDFDRYIALARRDISAGDSGSARDHLNAAADLCTGDLLESDPYEEWTIEPRRALAETHQWALAWLAADAVSSRDWPTALRHGRTMVWRDSCNEEGHRLIIQAHNELGNRGEAIRQYRKCVETLESEIGVAPSRETRALAASVVGS
jgi:DNA-binding SARP family transcriptional activator